MEASLAVKVIAIVTLQGKVNQRRVRARIFRQGRNWK